MQHFAGGEVKGCEQVDDAVALVVVGAPLDLAGSHRQDRLGAIERLDAGLLIDAQHHSVVGRVQVQPDAVADLVDEQRILGQLEGVGLPRLEPERLPDPAHRRRRHANLLGQIPGRPVRGVDRLVLQRLDHDPLDVVVGDRARRPRPRLIDQPVEALWPRIGAATCPPSPRGHPPWTPPPCCPSRPRTPTRSWTAGPATWGSWGAEPNAPRWCAPPQSTNATFGRPRPAMPRSVRPLPQYRELLLRQDTSRYSRKSSS
jgi:hypothetical protein